MKMNAFVMLAALSMSGAALAQQTYQPQKPMQGQEMGEQKEISGKVLGMHEKTLYIEDEKGAALPIQVTHETSLAGTHIKKDQRIESHLKKSFQPGEEVRTSFKVEKHRDGKVENVATSVEKQQ